MATFTPPTTKQWSQLHSLPSQGDSPSALQRLSDFSMDAHRLKQLVGDSERIAVYLHIPFCRELCNFCNCSIVVTRQYGLAAQYVEMLRKEIRWFGGALAKTPAVTKPLEKLYLGGGTPTFLQADDLTKLINAIDGSFGVSNSPERDYCIEIDPRFFNQDTAELLQSLGFNRIHFGLEDFSNPVQQAINRKYTVERIQQAVGLARTVGIKWVSIDLLYGLPAQTLASFTATLNQVARLQPSRVFFHPFKHQPGLFPSQKTLDSTLLPGDNTVLEQQAAAVNFWQSQGYECLGTDGFVRKGDPLFDQAGTQPLFRCQRGYSNGNFDSQLGMGMAATSQTDGAIWQNQGNLRDYIKQVMKQEHAVFRGLDLNEDDRLRRRLTEKLLCNQSINKLEFEKEYGQSFDKYFADELITVEHMEMDSLIANTSSTFALSTVGRWYAREIAAIFDSNAL